jgi:TatD DNase family protein
MQTGMQSAQPAIYDAHNHAHDQRLQMDESMWAAVLQQNVRKMVVNGSSEQDWPAVLQLARQRPQVIPSFGCHPWYIRERSGNWETALVHHLEQLPSGVGEIGLDRWIEGHDVAEQQLVFVRQIQMPGDCFSNC